MVRLKYTVLLILVVLTVVLQGCKQQTQPSISAIAHAGGGFNGKTYTNSIEALNYNYSRGFELFEIDFSWTNDGHMVCLHDWEKAPAFLFNHPTKKPLSLSQFKALKNVDMNLTPCDINSLNQWLSTHPKAYIVTDIKSRNIEGLEAMFKLIDNAQHRIIPQFTQPEHYPLVKAMGYEAMIWTLYSYMGTDESVINEAEHMDLYALTMPPHMAKRNLANEIKPLHIPTYVHTINNLQQALDYQTNWGLTSVYTDFLEMNFNDSNE